MSVEDPISRQVQNGRAFILDAPATATAICGSGTEVAWAAGESLMIVGPQGVGKSTLAEQLAFARGGITEPEWLGYPVKVDEDRRVLYFAADRPVQIARSMRRMVTDEHADLLAARLVVWRGPLPFDVVSEPLRLAELCESLGAGTVIVDSVKDLASPLSEDKVGAAWNRARGAAIARGIEWVDVHHNRKATSDNTKPRALSDVYGSTWITAGAGSVLSIWGEPGDPIVELTHLKQPADEIGPLELEHDHRAGTTRRVARPDAWSLLHSSDAGTTAKDAAEATYSRPTRAQIEKIRRRLERYVDEGHAIADRGALRTDQVRYRPTREIGSVKPREGTREGTRTLHAASRTPVNTGHAPFTHPASSPPPLRGEGEREATRVPACTCISPPDAIVDGRCTRCNGAVS